MSGVILGSGNDIKAKVSVLTSLCAAPPGFRAVLFEGLDKDGSARLTEVQVAAFGLYMRRSHAGQEWTEGVAMLLIGASLVPVSEVDGVVGVLPPGVKVSQIRPVVEQQMRLAMRTASTSEGEPDSGE